MFKTKYRIIKKPNDLYYIQSRPWWLLFWIDLLNNYATSFSTLVDAKQEVQRLKERDSGLNIVWSD